jgi:predicted flap endonuclease-1-like 5' DNA nuclease
VLREHAIARFPSIAYWQRIAVGSIEYEVSLNG